MDIVVSLQVAGKLWYKQYVYYNYYSLTDVYSTLRVNQEDKETFYQVRLHEVKNNRNYEARLDEDENVTLWEKTENGESQVEQIDVKNYALHYQGNTTMENLEIAHSVVDLISKIIGWLNPLNCIFGGGA